MLLEVVAIHGNLSCAVRLSIGLLAVLPVICPLLYSADVMSQNVIVVSTFIVVAVCRIARIWFISYYARS